MASTNPGVPALLDLNGRTAELRTPGDSGGLRWIKWMMEYGGYDTWICSYVHLHPC